MNPGKTVVLMSVVIAGLAGLSIAQYLQINEQSQSIANLKEEILEELRQTVAAPAPNGQEQEQDQGPALSGPRSARAVSAYEPQEPPRALSDTEYWISSDYSDDKPYGFSAWLELVSGGHFILERRPPTRACWPGCHIVCDLSGRSSDTQIGMTVSCQIS